MNMEELRGQLLEKEKNLEDSKSEKEKLVMEKNSLDEQFTHVLRKMKRLEKENSDMKESYH